VGRISAKWEFSAGEPKPEISSCEIRFIPLKNTRWPELGMMSPRHPPCGRADWCAPQHQLSLAPPFPGAAWHPIAHKSAGDTSDFIRGADIWYFINKFRKYAAPQYIEFVPALLSITTYGSSS
jgi:hypothetical protein